ncbi:MAG: CoA pyrophosphatase [Elusimicrobiota bacterium]
MPLRSQPLGPSALSKRRKGTATSIQTAVSIILTPGSRGLDALFIQRSERIGDPWSGHIAFPGGRREHDDADDLATAIRETHEEIGVALSRDKLLGRLEDLYSRETTLPPIVIRPFVFGLPHRPPVTLGSEVSAVYWLALDDLPASQASSRVNVGGRIITVPSFSLAQLPTGRVVWGLTYRILHRLLKHL